VEKKIIKGEIKKEKKDSARIIQMKMMERMMVRKMKRKIVRVKMKMIILRENQGIAVFNMILNLRNNCIWSKTKMEMLNQFKK